MARSRRRAKKTQAKVRVGVKRKSKFARSRLPDEYTNDRPQIEDKLGAMPDWDTSKTFIQNYSTSGFISNPNKGFGRNVVTGPTLEGDFDEDDEEAVAKVDDELKATCGKVRETGPAPPPRITTTQRVVVKRLLERHGDDVEAMARDRKLNPMLHTAAQLRKLIEGYRVWAPTDRHDFRAPKKHL